MRLISRRKEFEMATSVFSSSRISRVVFIAALACCSAAVGASPADAAWAKDWPAGPKPSAVARRIAEQFLLAVPDKYDPPCDGCGVNVSTGGIDGLVASIWKDAMECARIVGDAPVEERLVSAFEPYFSFKRHIFGTPSHDGPHIAGVVPLEIAILTGDTRAKALGLGCADAMLRDSAPAWPQPDFFRSVYMAVLLETRASILSGDAKYAERAAETVVRAIESRQRPDGLFLTKAGRGRHSGGCESGWMAAAMALALERIPDGSALRPRILEAYIGAMKALFSHQRDDGMWGGLVDYPGSPSGVACTAMIAAAAADGIRNGWIDAGQFGPAVRRAFLAVAADKSRRCRRDQAAVLMLCRAVLSAAYGRDVHVPAPECGPQIINLREELDDVANSFELVNLKADGFRGIWYYNQPSGDEYVYKYSGGMGVYCAGHLPMAVYSPQARKTFFTFGGTDERNTTLLQSVSYYDHETHKLARPTIVFDKHTIDAHDNAVINIDDCGYIYLFSSSHGRSRPSAIARSRRPYDISEFEVTWSGNFSYPQPFFFPGEGFLLLHAWYVAGRANCFMTGTGSTWTDRSRLSYFNMGHYLRAWQFPGAPGVKAKVGASFDQHPKGKGLNWRTDIYYAETDDFGRTWKTAAGEVLKLPLGERDNPALALSYAEKGRNVYIKGVKFDGRGRPIVLSIVSKGYRAGPVDGPREWKLARWTGSEWREIDTGIRSDNNYDFAELYVDGERDWRIIGASETGPQPYNPGGEIASWVSHDAGETWSLEKKLTSGSERNQNYPRQPLGYAPGFYAFWADGNGRRPSLSRLYFCDRDLNVYMMPLSFEGDFADPEPYRPAGSGR